MKNELKELSIKIDKILENQEMILKYLSQSTKLPNEPFKASKKLTKKELRKQRDEEIGLIIAHRYRIKSLFNLAAAPQPNRILAYLRTNDESIFSGLKRKK